MNRVERFKKFAQRNKVISIVLIFGTVVISVGAFTHALDETIGFLQKHRLVTRLGLRSFHQVPSSMSNPDWQQNARNCIGWVFADQGARNTYLSARQRGLSKFEAILYAEKHDLGAQRLVADYGEQRTLDFIKSR